LDYSHACTTLTGMRVQGSAWLFAIASWNVTTAESGSNPNPDAVPSSVSRSRSDDPGARRPLQILIAEDSQSDVRLIQKALQKSGLEAQIHVADNGEKAVQFIQQAEADATAPCPDIVLLDINMPRYKGGDILRKIRASTRCKDVLVLVVTSSDSSRDRAEMDALGANGYFRKPSALSEFMTLGEIVRDLLTRRDEKPM